LEFAEAFHQLLPPGGKRSKNGANASGNSSSKTAHGLVLSEDVGACVLGIVGDGSHNVITASAVQREVDEVKITAHFPGCKTSWTK
jgi:hypothetical protein